MDEFFRGLCTVATTALTAIVGVYYTMVRKQARAGKHRARRPETRGDRQPPA